MASFVDLYNLRNNSDLLNRVTVACVIAAEAVRTESDQTANHANRLLWAARVFENPDFEAKRMLWALLAKHNSLTVGQLTGAPDADILTAVNGAVNLFATGA